MKTSDWVTFAVSLIALGISGATLLFTIRWRGIDRADRDDLERNVARWAVRVKVEKLLMAWRNSILSGEFAVRDDNWEGLLNRASEWRRNLAGELEELLRNTKGRHVRASALLQETVAPMAEFEDAVRPLIARRDPSKDPYEDKLEVQRALQKLQEAVKGPLDELLRLSDEQLMEPTSRE